MKDINISEKIGHVQAAVAQFGFTATAASDSLILVQNRRGQLCACVTAHGVEQKYQGSGKNLCGALVRNAITAALDARLEIAKP